MGLQAQLWRAIAAFRFASLAYAAVLLVVNRGDYWQPLLAWGVLAAMTAWTVFTTVAYARPARRTRALLTADVVVTAAALLSTIVLQNSARVHGPVMPVTATWAAGPVLAWAVAEGRRAGLAAGAVLGACDILRHHPISSAFNASALNGPILLLLAGWVVGYVSRLAATAELAVQQAAQTEASSRERERIARDIHDSVLQVLALVHRRGAEAGGEAAELGRLAGEQETALRALIGAGGAVEPESGQLDLRALLSRETSGVVSVVTPAEPVRLAADAARETASAVRAALDNIRRHCGDGRRPGSWWRTKAGWSPSPSGTTARASRQDGWMRRRVTGGSGSARPSGAGSATWAGRSAFPRSRAVAPRCSCACRARARWPRRRR